MVRRRLGEILETEFAWNRQDLDRAIDEQRRDPNRRLLGHYLRNGTNKGSSRWDVALALLMQRAEPTPAPSFDALALEYRELGELLRFERGLVDLRLRRYASAVIVLLIAAGYPLAAILSSDGTSGKELIETESLVRVYGVMLACLCIVVLALGDGAVRKYGEYLKRRSRITASRRLLRARLIPAGLTVMPLREAGENERPDPYFSAFQKRLPLWAGGWSITQVLLLMYAIALVDEGSLRVQADAVRHAALITSLAFPAWSWVASKGCLRYKMLVEEARLLAVDSPFPRADVSSSRGRALFWAAYAVLYLLALGSAVWGWMATKPFGGWLHVALTGVFAALWGLLRVLEVYVATRSVQAASRHPVGGV